ncbi:UNVERIFIED_CONTAM: phage integrase family protein [Murimonas intestini]|uniref:Phage integrase family protein n=1 Tax=Murimonas intestini TaxID=1337051 RepID=A0AB73SYN3_9FIRM|nr:site-specific integrase [Murimonas intestini]
MMSLQDYISEKPAIHTELGLVLMANSRKGHKGRKLREGESWRSDGRYSYRCTDVRTGKRLTIYAQDLPELRDKEEVKAAKKEHRKAELLPKISAHIMRHTVCTRMAECRMDIKVLQYIMGHAHIDVTMEVYNHLGDRARIENEVAKLDSMAVNF